jgi:hypothetical protein
MTYCAKGNLGLHHRNEEGTKEAYHPVVVCAATTRLLSFDLLGNSNSRIPPTLILQPPDFYHSPPCPQSSLPPVLEVYINNGRQQGPRPRRHAVSGSVRPRKTKHIVRSRFDRRAVCHQPSKQERARRGPERGRSRQRREAVI